MNVRRTLILQAAHVALATLAASVAGAAFAGPPRPAAARQSSAPPIRIRSEGTAAGYFLRIADGAVEHLIEPLADPARETPGGVKYGLLADGDYVYQANVWVNAPYVIERVQIRDVRGELLAEVVSPSPSARVSWSFAVCSIADPDRRRRVALDGRVDAQVVVFRPSLPKPARADGSPVPRLKS